MVIIVKEEIKVRKRDEDYWERRGMLVGCFNFRQYGQEGLIDKGIFEEVIWIFVGRVFQVERGVSVGILKWEQYFEYLRNNEVSVFRMK